MSSDRIISNILTGCAGMLVVFSLGWYVSRNPAQNISMRIPGMDGQPKRDRTELAEDVRIGENFQKFDNLPIPIPGSWPGFRGDNKDNIVAGAGELAGEWEGSPGLLWTVGLGEGYAGAAVWEGRVFVLDYDEDANADSLRCFALDDGRELWRRWYDLSMKRNHGMSRTVPAVSSSGNVVTLGPKGHVMCVDGITGDLKWTLDLQKSYGTQIPFWYAAQCPLIDEEVAVLAPAGDVLMLGIDCNTGQILWETPNPDEYKMSHSSVIPMEIENRRMYVYSALGGVAGVGAEQDNVGEILWSSSAWNHSVVAPSPVALDSGRVFLTAGYGAGSMLLGISSDNDQYQVEILDEYGPSQGLASEQHTPIFYQGYLFGVLPRDGGGYKQQFACYNVNDCRSPVWSSSSAKRFGLGPYILADGKFYVLEDSGVLTVARLSFESYIQVDSVRLFEGRNTWAPIAIAGKRMIVRDDTTMFCFDIGKADSK